MSKAATLTKWTLCGRKARELRRVLKATAKRAKAMTTKEKTQRAKDEVVARTLKARVKIHKKANMVDNHRRLVNGVLSTTQTLTTLVNATPTKHFWRNKG